MCVYLKVFMYVCIYVCMSFSMSMSCTTLLHPFWRSTIFFGKLAYNFITSHLVSISGFVDTIKKSIKEKKRYYLLLQGKAKTKFGYLCIWGFPISPLNTSSKGGFPLKKKERLCVITIYMSNQIYRKIGYSRIFVCDMFLIIYFV